MICIEVSRIFLKQKVSTNQVEVNGWACTSRLNYANCKADAAMPKLQDAETSTMWHDVKPLQASRPHCTFCP